MDIQELNVGDRRYGFFNADLVSVSGAEAVDSRALRVEALRLGDFDLLFVAEMVMGSFLAQCEFWTDQVGNNVNWLTGVRRLHDLVEGFAEVEAEGVLVGVGEWAQSVYKEVWRGIIERVEPADQKEIKAALKKVAKQEEVVSFERAPTVDRS